MSSSTQPLRVAIVGAGQMARHHARALSRIDVPNDVVAVFDPDEPSRKELLDLCPSARGGAHVDATSLRGVTDVVHVCTPPPTHGRLARIALEAGCHVYVEKPFAESVEEAREILSLARERKLQVCAGHQLLFEPPTRRVLKLRESLGGLSHIESFFAFRPSRRGMAADEQLKDVLPHPLYLLLHFLEAAAPGTDPRAEAIRVGTDGTVHALIESGGVVGSLVVTLTGRPVESYLKVVGTNGTVKADYVRSLVLRAIGPGSSAIDKVLQPFRTARQLTFGTTGSLGRRLLRRERSYPGLAEIFEAFYGSIATGEEPPLSDRHLLDTIRLYRQIADRIEGDRSGSKRGESDSDVHRVSVGAVVEKPRGVVVTGGTGFLGSEVVRQLVAAQVPVRVLSRRTPARWDRIEGADYRTADLGARCPPSLLHGFSGVIHCAAETSGGWDDHQRNSIDATELLIRAAASAGVPRMIHVSSIAVLASPMHGEGVREGIGLEPEDRRAGPYVWGKLNSERLAVQLGDELEVRVKVARPGAIVDYEAFEPPGRLGRRIGNLFVAVGPGSERLGVVDLRFAARTLVWMIRNFEDAPDELNVLSPDLPSRKELVERLRARSPGLRVVWLPWFALRSLSALGVLGQKVARAGRQPIRVDRAFAAERYDTRRIAALERMITEADARDASSARAVLGR